MRTDVLKAVISNIATHEGRKPQMYLDTLGIVTCGVGHAVMKADDATCFDWHRIDRPATRDEVIADYTGVKYAKRKGTLFLPAEEMDRLLAYDLGRFEHILEAEFPELHDYPVPAQVALFDLAYNCGSLRKFPKLTAAVLAGDWHTAAKESARPQVGSGRNQDTEQQFFNCNPA